MADLKSIKESLGTGPLGLSPTLRTETRTCSCGKEFTAYIKVEDGKDILDGLAICRSCREEQEYQKYKSERIAELPKLQIQGRDGWKKACNLPALFIKKTFDNFEKKLQLKAYDIMKNYDIKSMASIILLSPNLYGVGKTHLVAALINDLIEKTEPAVFYPGDCSIRWRRCPAYFTSENNLLARIRNTFNSNVPIEDEDYENEEMIYQELIDTPLLIIDDVGKVRPRDYSFLQGVYFRIIDSRYTSQQPIILTTNLSFTELEEHIGGACSDRLREMCGDENFVVMKGKSYRKKSE